MTAATSSVGMVSTQTSTRSKRPKAPFRSEHQLLHIIDTVPSMLWATSPTGEPTHVSRRLREYSGSGLEEFLNLGWEKFIHPDDFEDTARAFFKSMQTGEPY